MSSNKTIYLIDGSAYIYRAYHAIPHLSTSTGLSTNATLGFTKILIKLLNEKNPQFIAVVFDSRGPTFRHHIYEEYKANRPPMPDDLAEQIPYIKEIVQALNISTFEEAGYEGDDIIGTMVQRAEKSGFRTVMVTGDKDFRQLITTKSIIWDPMKDQITDYLKIKHDYGLEPSQWIDVLALTGDISDNIPGVPGIGEKTALALIKRFGSLEVLYENLDQITKKKQRENLRAFREQTFLNRRLVTIETNVPIDIDFESLKLSSPDNERLGDIFKRLEFRQLQKVFPLNSTEAGTVNYQAVHDKDALLKLIDRLKKAEVLALDLETTSTDPMRARIVGLSFAFSPHEAYYIPCRHNYKGVEAQLDLQETLDALKPVLEDPRIVKGGQNIKYDWIVLAREGINLKGVRFDTMIASYLLNPSLKAHNLENIALDYLGHKMISYKEVVGQGKNALGFEQVPIEEAVPYACEDADISLRAWKVLEPRLKQEGFEDLFYKVEMPLVQVLVEMEMTGIRVDKDHLILLSKKFEREIEQIEDQIYSLAGESFNINSHQQLGRILFEKLKLPIQKKTKKKTGYSTDVEVLTALSLVHELPALVLRYRTLNKLKTTYADALIELINPDTERIHTSYNQTITATGRLSSSDPNLQNIPVRTEEGREIRAAFVPRTGWLILSADYSQIELRVLAHYSKDPILVKAFQKDEDIHLRTAAQVFQLSPPFVTSEMRRQAKVINFGIIYGMSPFRLAKELGIGNRTAKRYIDNYFKEYQGVHEFIKYVVDEARKNGKVTTLLGRHRYIPEIRSKNRKTRELAERLAINTPIQGTAADLIKLAMIRTREAIYRCGLETKMLLQVHDELVFEVPEDELEKAEEVIRKEMEGVYQLDVPLKVDTKWGNNWAEAH